ncbi:ATP-binding cassette domain-containing protein [bacterium]|nr:ATP-binding cassette domain-containing protein [bacterium]
MLLKKSSFQLDSREILGIVGPSGSGKSTLLKSLIRMHSASEGDIDFKGISVEKYSYPELRQQIAYLPQQPTFFEGTIQENLLFPFELRQNRKLATPDNEATLRDHLKTHGLEKPLDFNVTELSGGESQRLALARITLLNPTIILLDEPTSGLDPTSSDHIIEQIKRWKDETAGAILWIMHDRSVLKKLECDVLNIENQTLKRYTLDSFLKSEEQTNDE